MILAGAVVVGLTSPTSAHGNDGRVLVRRGETLLEIALRVGVGQSALAATNGISDHDLVYSGTWLTVPAGGGAAHENSGGGAALHQVAPGETLWGIGQRYGVSAEALARANGITDPDLVIDGRRLSIPSATAAGGVRAAGTRSAPSGLPARLRANPGRMVYLPVFDRWSAAYGVPADLVKATTYLESGWQNSVVSVTGAVGIGQLMPDTVTFMNELIGADLDPAVPEQNIRMSARYLAWLLGRTGSTQAALAGYYQGLASVAERGLYPSTIAYVDGVVALRSRF